MVVEHKTNERFFPLNWLRAAAALMVVMFHCHVVMALPKYFGVPVFPLSAAGDSGVQIFFVLSGFVIFFAHRFDAEGSRDSLVRFTVRRFRKIFLPLCIVLLALIPIVAFVLPTSPPSLSDVLLAFLVLPSPNERLLAVEWTLRHEVLFYCLFAVFLWWRKPGLVLLLLWGVFGSAYSILADSHWLIAFIFSPNHMLFLFGMGVAVLVGRGERRGGVAALTAGGIVFASGYGLSLHKSLEGGGNVLILGVGAAGMIYGASCIRSWNRPVPMLDRAGEASYALYLIHFPLISAIVKIALVVDRSLSLPLELYFVAIVTICQLAALLFHRLIEKPIIELASRWKPRLAGAG